MNTASHTTDFFELVKSAPRDQFISACPWFFLVGADTLVKPRGPQRTIIPQSPQSPLPEQLRGTSRTAELSSAVVALGLRPLVLSVRKVQPIFPNMITLGRTANNDIVVPDISVSKFHAFFKLDGEKAELTDAGSRNGSYIAGRQLVANAPPTRIGSGDTLRFGQRTFDFLSAAHTWDRLRKVLGTA